MTSSAQSSQQSRTVETELLAVDLVASFHLHDKFRIDHYCDEADQLADANSDFSRVLREMGDCLNEKDRVEETWSLPLDLSHDLAKDWFGAIQASSNFDDYLRATERTQDLEGCDNGHEVFQLLKLSQSQSQGLAPSQVPSSSFPLPPANQQQHQQQREKGEARPATSPTRRSSRTHKPRKLPGFVIDGDKSYHQGSPDAVSASRTTPAYDEDPDDSSEDELPSPSKPVGTPRSDTATAHRSSSKATRASTAKKRNGKTGNQVSKGKKVLPAGGASSAESMSGSEQGEPAHATREEEALLETAMRSSAASAIGKKVRRPKEALQPVPTRKRALSAISLSSEGSVKDLGSDDGNDDDDLPAAGQAHQRDDRVSSTSAPRVAPSTSSATIAAASASSSAKAVTSASSMARSAVVPGPWKRMKQASFNRLEYLASGKDNQVTISAPAYASKEGFTTSRGYQGFHYLKSFKSSKDGAIKESWLCVDCGHEYTAARGHSSNLKTHKKLCRGRKDATAARKLVTRLESLGLDATHLNEEKSAPPARASSSAGVQPPAVASGSNGSMMRSW
ncbi:hypothetical protein V8E36_006451 [Tilletia maclaganii]